MQILILAGKSVDRQYLEAMLVDHAYTLVRLSAVSRGVRRLEKQDVDCVLVMPDGKDQTWRRAVKRIRLEYNRHVIVMTDDPRNEDDALEYGAYDWVRAGHCKPSRLRRILRHLQSHLRLEQQLEKERALIRWMEETDKFGYWSMDETGRVQWSTGIQRVLNTTGTDLADNFLSVRPFVHPDDIEVYDKANKATFEEGWPLDFEYRVVGTDGEIRHLHAKREVELDPGGNVVRAYGMARDVSLYKEFEELLYRRDAILQVLTRTAGELLLTENWEEGLNNALIELGRAAEVSRIFFFTKSDDGEGGDALSLRFEWASDDVPEDMRISGFSDGTFSARYKAWRNNLLMGKVMTGHVRDLHKAERELFEATGAKSIMIVPVFAGSNWWGVIGLSENRREREWLPMEVESIVMAANIFGSAIQYGILGRELMAANRSAEEASAAALEANMAKSMFLANMSHEIRTPISGILGMAEMMVTTGLTEEQREHMDMIRDAAGGLLRIINDILDISKIEAGKMELKPVDYEFRSELDTIVRSFGPQAELNNLVFRYSVSEGVPVMVNGDADRLGQVLWNLIGNAMKFTERGLVELTVEVSKREADRTCLLFKVMDTGVGIEEGKLNSIFDSFTQADSSLRKKHQGTGLGLTISRQLVNMMGGEIGVESKVGMGTTFHFTAWVGVAEEQKPVVKKQEKTTPETLHLNILLAEDNPLNRKYLTHFLSMFGHTIVQAQNGLEVLRVLAAKGREIDLVLMDVQMPEMSGIEATRAIRESSGKKYDRTIPIIALTAYAMKGDRERMLEAGMDDYVSKPVDMQALSAAIVRCMTQSPSKKRRPLSPSSISAPTPPKPVEVELDMDGLMARFEGNTELLKDILDLFILEADDKLKNLEKSATAQDAKRMGIALHSITNIASHVLAMDIVTQSRKLEKKCYLGEVDEVVEELEELKPRFVSLVASVKKYAGTL